MTVQEMINKLQAVPNKNVRICVRKPVYHRGSSWTGIYLAGHEPIDIENLQWYYGDKLAGISELDEIDHVEIISDED